MKWMFQYVPETADRDVTCSRWITWNWSNSWRNVLRPLVRPNRDVEAVLVSEKIAGTSGGRTRFQTNFILFLQGVRGPFFQPKKKNPWPTVQLDTWIIKKKKKEKYLERLTMFQAPPSESNGLLNLVFYIFTAWPYLFHRCIYLTPGQECSRIFWPTFLEHRRLLWNFSGGRGRGGQPLGRMGFRVKNEFLTCTAKKVKSEICEIFASWRTWNGGISLKKYSTHLHKLWEIWGWTRRMLWNDSLNYRIFREFFRWIFRGISLKNVQLICINCRNFFFRRKRWTRWNVEEPRWWQLAAENNGNKSLGSKGLDRWLWRSGGVINQPLASSK